MNTAQTPLQSIFPFVRTTHQADELLMHIDAILAKLYTIEQQPFEKVAFASLDPQIAKAIHDTYLSYQLSWSNSEEIKNFFTTIKDTIKHLSVITLTIAYRPTNDGIESLSNWTRTNIYHNTLLEINVDQDLIGGAIIVFRGNYLDLSVKKKLDNYFTEHKGDILKELI